jgi:hypothetical protein
MQTRRCLAGRASFSSASRSSACNPRAAACDVDERGRRRAQRADTVRPSRPSRCPQRSGDGDGAIGGVVLARARTSLLHRARLHTTPANASGSIAAQQADCPGAARRVKGARIYWQRSRICTQLTPSIPPCPCWLVHADQPFAPAVVSRKIGFRGCATRARPGLRIRYHSARGHPSWCLLGAALPEHHHPAIPSPARRSQDAPTGAPADPHVPAAWARWGRRRCWLRAARPSTACALHGHLCAIDGVLHRRQIGEPMAALPGRCTHRPSCDPTLCSSDRQARHC